MPPVSRRRRADVNALSDDELRHLTHGRPFFGGFRDDRERFEQAWAAHGETITADYIAQHPGRRPFGWWLLTHKQERPIVGEWMSLERIAAERKREPFGFLHGGISTADQSSRHCRNRKPITWTAWDCSPKTSGRSWGTDAAPQLHPDRLRVRANVFALRMRAVSHLQDIAAPHTWRRQSATSSM
jgi:hypothetical protein